MVGWVIRIEEASLEKKIIASFTIKELVCRENILI
jgi:hypothetical protein